MRCAIASCELRCAVAICDVRVPTHFGETFDVRASGAFLGLRSAIPISHFFLAIMQDMKINMPFAGGAEGFWVAELRVRQL